MKEKNKKNKLSDIETKKDVKYHEVASGGVVYFLDDDDKPRFLLLKHKGVKKHWDLPKGHLKKKESIQECAIREVLEETGIPKDKMVLIKELKHKNIYAKRTKLGRKQRKIVHLFLFKSLTDKAKLSHEHSEYKWVKYENLVNKLTYPQTSLLAFVEAFDIIKDL